MAVRRGFLLLAFACCVISKKEEIGQSQQTIRQVACPITRRLFDPCSKTDIKCLRKATETFLEHTCNGLPKYDIKPLDPLIIPELDIVVDEDMGLVFKFKSMNITGLKNLQISDFKMNTDAKSVVLKTKAEIHIAADLNIGFTKKDKSFTGSYTATTTALGSSSYGYSLIKKDNVEYFEVGPETNTCEILGEPDVTISDNLQNALHNDPDARNMKPGYETNKVTLRKKTLCKIVETAYITVIHNIRASGRAFPKCAFFNDI